MDEYILFLSWKNGTAHVTALERDGLGEAWVVDTGFPGATYLLANRGKWVAGQRTTAPDGDELSVVHQFAYGDASGRIILRHEFPRERYVVLQGSVVHPVSDGFLYWDDGRTWYARPEAMPAITVYLQAIGGGGLLLVGLAWPAAAAAALHRTASGGKTKCLNCGKKRTADVAFCSKCGWRTDDEEETAIGAKQRERNG